MLHVPALVGNDGKGRGAGEGPSEESPTAGQILKGDLILLPGETCWKKLITGGLGNGLCSVPALWVLTL